jgi:hypothetical protein
MRGRSFGEARRGHRLNADRLGFGDERVLHLLRLGDGVHPVVGGGTRALAVRHEPLDEDHPTEHDRGQRQQRSTSRASDAGQCPRRHRQGARLLSRRFIAARLASHAARRCRAAGARCRSRSGRVAGSAPVNIAGCAARGTGRSDRVASRRVGGRLQARLRDGSRQRDRRPIRARRRLATTSTGVGTGSGRRFRAGLEACAGPRRKGGGARLDGRARSGRGAGAANRDAGHAGFSGCPKAGAFRVGAAGGRDGALPGCQRFERHRRLGPRTRADRVACRWGPRALRLARGRL